MGRRSALAAAAAVIAAMLLATTGAVASPSQESDFVSRINSERTSRGLRAVTVKSDLVSVARAWSDHMAAAGSISHDPDLPNEVDGWTALGDNVGKGPTVASVHEAFMNSSAHRSIILDSRFNQVGVGVTQSGDYIYVTEVFARRGSTTAVVKTTTRRATTTTTTRRTSAGSARLAEYRVDLTGRVWEIDFGSRALTVAVLEQLVGLDARRVDPATGIPAA
jgi:Cysteine-rich secretory protein family